MTDSGHFPPPSPPPTSQPGTQPPPYIPGYRLVPVRPGFGAAHWLHLTTFALGLVGLFMGFMPANELLVAGEAGYTETGTSLSFYEGGAGLGPALLFVAGLVALLAVLPGGNQRPGPIVPALSIGLTLEMMFSMFVLLDGVEMAAGGIIFMVLCVLQAFTALTAYVLDTRSAQHRPGTAPWPGGHGPQVGEQPTVRYPTQQDQPWPRTGPSGFEQPPGTAPGSG